MKELKLLGEPDPVIGKSSSQSKLSAVKQTVPKNGKPRSRRKYSNYEGLLNLLNQKLNFNPSSQR